MEICKNIKNLYCMLWYRGKKHNESKHHLSHNTNKKIFKATPLLCSLTLAAAVVS